MLCIENSALVSGWPGLVSPPPPGGGNHHLVTVSPGMGGNRVPWGGEGCKWGLDRLVLQGPVGVNSGGARCAVHALCEKSAIFQHQVPEDPFVYFHVSLNIWNPNIGGRLSGVLPG